MSIRLAAAFAGGAASGALALWGLLRHRLGARGGTLARRVPPPHPGWQPGQPQPAPFDGGAMIQVDPAATEKAAMYALVISTVVPRPIAFISSVCQEGNVNLAPYSYFNVVSHNPPTVVIGCCRSPGRGGEHKDTLLNIQQTG
jgi:hypothetical protein